MKEIFMIFIRDLKRIFRNPAAAFIIFGLCIMPSLYAWINIKACWDPYANTGNLPIAVVNNDEGAELNGNKINAGDNIMSALKKNKQIKWVFLDEWQANYGLNNGKYYALIEVPSDFSNGLVSLTTTSPSKPHIVYKVNDKLNAIAAKITNAAKDNVVKQVKSKFVEEVNKEVLKVLNTVGVQLKKDKPEIVQISDTINEADSDMDSIKKYIAEADTSSEGLQSFLTSLKGKLPKITQQINNLEKVAESSKALIQTSKQTVTSAAYDLNNDMMQMQTINQNVQTTLSKLKDMNNSSDTSQMISTINDTINACNSLSKLIDSDIDTLNSLNETLKNSNINTLISQLNALKVVLANEENLLNSLKGSIQNGNSKEAINSSIDNASAASNQVAQNMVTASNYFYLNVMQVVNSESDALSSSLSNIEGILESSKVIEPQLETVANFGISGSKLTVNEANQLSSKLTTLQNEISGVSGKLKGLNEESLNKIINLMEMNPDAISSFISSPIDVKNVDVYDTGTFGVGLTPFYTVLAIWVGSLLLSAMLTVECSEFKNGKKLNTAQKYFGKLMLYMSISLIQVTIITLGDVYLLGVHPANITLMFEFAYMCSFTFTIIIFTLVSLFGNVGKAIGVVMMVFQIAGAGGIYPIQTNPQIFGKLYPLWPFTYGINGFREAISGPIWDSVNKNMEALLTFVFVFLFLALFIKPLHRITRILERKFKQAGI